MATQDLTATREIYWIIHLTVHPGREAAFRRVSGELIESARQEPGCLAYEWSVGEDGRTVHIYERYADAAAVKIHSERSGAKVGELAQLVSFDHFAVYGGVTDAVREDLSGLHAGFLKPLGGFSRG